MGLSRQQELPSTDVGKGVPETVPAAGSPNPMESCDECTALVAGRMPDCSWWAVVFETKPRRVLTLRFRRLCPRHPCLRVSAPR